MQCSNHSSLIEPLRDLLKSHRRELEERVIDDIEDTISAL